MTAAVDGELVGRRRRALDRHLADCEACRTELQRSERLDELLGLLPSEATMSAKLEQDTLRRVRIAAADDAEQPATSAWRRWIGITVPALAAAAVLAVAVGISRTPPTTTPSPDRATPPPPVASAPHEPTHVAKATPKPPPAASGEASEPTAVAEARRPIDPSRRPELPKEPPPELAAAPDLFMDMNILSNMEKLQHYDAIETTTVHDPTGEQPNG
jgi:hypothetical protein